jgi:hypothetical protein
VSRLQLHKLSQRLWRDPQRPHEVAAELLEALPDPPRREGRERHAAVGVEAVQGPEQADAAFLNQVAELEPLCAVRTRERDDQRQESLDQLFASR